MTTPDTPVERQDVPSTTEEAAIDETFLVDGSTPTLDLVKRTVNSITTEAQLEQVLEALVRVQWLKKVAKDLETQAEEAILFWMKANGVPSFDLGEVRYYIGDSKTTKARSNRDVLEALLTATGGDVDAIASHMGSSAWKYGSVRTVVGEERFGELFETKVKEVLEEGKPKKQLLSVPTKYLGGSK